MATAYILDLLVMLSVQAFVAQWLEHWSRKPGVESSNLSKGFFASFFFHSNLSDDELLSDFVDIDWSSIAYFQVHVHVCIVISYKHTE